ncbi:hypothetical protein U9R90_34135 [Streptomyces sp. E11-3]|uniref:hypothetical protein n=1 Tax=Streptomyces sp. E11-3 TaxID=3110112 RepID=UPI0039801AD2
MRGHMRTRIRSAAAVGAAAVLVALAGAGPAPAHDTAKKKAGGDGVARVHGSGRIAYVYSPDDDIRFTLDARAVPFSQPLPGLPGGLPTDARGTVKFSHHVAETGVTVAAEARVDCLVTGGRTATLTAVITKSDVSEVGKRLGISVYEGRGGEPDRLGFSWGVANTEPESTDDNGQVVQPNVGTCMAPAPFAPVTKGGFDVRHAELPPLPEAHRE